MAIWTAWTRRLWDKGALSNPDVGFQVGSTEKIHTSAGISVKDERALGVSAVWACVQLIANSVASLPLGVYQRTEDGRRELGAEDRQPLVDLLHKSPNAQMKPRDFRLAMTTQMALWNNAYAEIVRSTRRPTALMPLRPGRMSPFLDPDGTLTYHYATDTGVKVFSKESILHLKGFGTDGIIGSERNQYSRESLGLTVSAETHAAKQFANGGRPGGVITFDKFLTKDQRKQVAKLYEGISEGAIQANKLWILEGGSQYKELDFAADQMQMLETRLMQLSEIARYFGVPEVMIGAGTNSSSAWPASLEQQILLFLTFTIQPYLDEWESAVADSLLPRNSDVFVDHDVSGFIKMDSESKAKFHSTLVQNGLETRNEARAAMNLPAMDGGDDLTAQVNLVPLDKLGEEPEVEEPEVEQDEFFERLEKVYTNVAIARPARSSG